MLRVITVTGLAGGFFAPAGPVAVSAASSSPSVHPSVTTRRVVALMRPPVESVVIASSGHEAALSMDARAGSRSAGAGRSVLDGLGDRDAPGEVVRRGVTRG